MKKILIVANWKMNPQKLTEAKKLFVSIKKGLKNACPELSRRVEVVICPPVIYLSNLLSFKSCGSNIKLGSQNAFWEEQGAFTGEISLKMLKSLGVKYIIIGHSERRKHFKETNKIIEKKLKSALALGLKPILCIDKLSQIPKDINDDYILAYEPLFAIGTGEPCSAEKAKKMREKINKKLVLYGGSVNSKNAEDYIEKSGFQGLLVGGASLNAREFLKIIQKLKN